MSLSTSFINFSISGTSSFPRILTLVRTMPSCAERLWSPLEATSVGNLNLTVLPRLHYFRCLLNHRGVAAAPVSNLYARSPPTGPGSCFAQ